MKVSQLTHAMDKDDVIVIDDYEAPIDKMTIYEGPVKGIPREDPMNKMHVCGVCACNDKILVLAIKPKKMGGGKSR